MSIIADIISKSNTVALRKDDWMVGTTADPEHCRSAHGDPGEWHCWDAEYPSIAAVTRDILAADGMTKTGIGGDGRFVYLLPRA